MRCLRCTIFERVLGLGCMECAQSQSVSVVGQFVGRRQSVGRPRRSVGQFATCRPIDPPTRSIDRPTRARSISITMFEEFYVLLFYIAIDIDRSINTCAQLIDRSIATDTMDRPGAALSQQLMPVVRHTRSTPPPGHRDARASFTAPRTRGPAAIAWFFLPIRLIDRHNRHNLLTASVDYTWSALVGPLSSVNCRWSTVVGRLSSVEYRRSTVGGRQSR